MKSLLLFAIVALSFNSVFAAGKCDKQVLSAYKNYVKKNTSNEFDGVQAVSYEYAEQSIQESQELNKRQKAQALKDIRKPDVALYEGRSSYMSGTGLEILVANAKTCQISKMIFWYAE